MKEKYLFLTSGLFILFLSLAFIFSTGYDNSLAGTGKWEFPEPAMTPVPGVTPIKVFISASRKAARSEYSHLLNYTLSLKGILKRNEDGTWKKNSKKAQEVREEFLANLTEEQREKWLAFLDNIQSWDKNEIALGKHEGGSLAVIAEDGSLIKEMRFKEGTDEKAWTGEDFLSLGSGSSTYDWPVNLAVDWGAKQIKDEEGEKEEAHRAWVPREGNNIIEIDGVKYELVGMASVSPIIIDLNGDDLPDVHMWDWMPHDGRFNSDCARMFDITGDGEEEYCEWLGSKDGLLVAPLDEVSVVGGCQLFGTAIGYVDGYEKLGLLRDKDGNGYVSGDELKGLKVWQDHNQDAVCQPEELTPVEKLGITSISTGHEYFVSTCTINGQECYTWDWWPTAVFIRSSASQE